MFRSLYSKLAAVFLILFTLVGIFVVIVFLLATEMYRQEVSQKLNRNLARNIVGEHPLIEDQRIRQETLEQLFHQLMVINPSIELYLLDPEGEILEFSAAPGKVKREQISLTPIRQWLYSEADTPLLGDDPRNPDKRKVFSAARIPEQGELQGYLYIILGGEDYDTIAQKIQDSFILTLTSWIILAGLFLAVMTGLLTFALLTRRLKNLSRAMAAFKNGAGVKSLNLPLTADTRNGDDELTDLSKNFKEMALRIEEQIEELRQSDALRRELVANVSHDLRTPLATLTAYIETLQLKENRLTPAELHEYLKIAHRHCNRLNSLINALFELAGLEAREAELEIEPFNLAELVQDVVQNFEPTVRKRSISLKTNIGQEIPLVMGDIRLLERALENLIINAIRHTPPNGTVSIILTPVGDRVKVQVTDTGTGISEADLPHIFERFYQTAEKQGPQSSDSSGLGLAIAKRIIEMHGNDIETESTFGSGTCFTFSLSTHPSS